MVSTINIVALFINAILTFIVPIIFIIYFILKKVKWIRPFIFGALTFFVSQIILRVPLTGAVSSFIPSATNITSWQYIVFSVISAVVFEELSKYIGIKIGLNGKGEWSDALSFGIGFASLNCILFSAISYISDIMVAFYINKNGIEGLLKAFSNNENAVSKVSYSLIDKNFFEIVLNGMNDIFWMFIQIALTIIIIYGLKFSFKKSLMYLIIASASHILIEGVVNIMGIYFNLSKTTSQLYYLALAIIAIYFIAWSKKSLFKDKTIN